MTVELDVRATELDGVLLITPPTLFADHRGAYVELYNERLYKEAGIEPDFIQDDISVSHKHVLRGIHGDAETAKLISCLEGEIFFVVVNNHAGSSQYRQWLSLRLSEENRLQVLVPPNFGNGHLVLSERAIFHYKQTTEYRPSGQFTLYWNDPELSIDWPVDAPILSRRDDPDA